MQPFKQRVCQHFLELKVSKSWRPSRSPSCKFCLLTRSGIWACLTKGCEAEACCRQQYLHLKSHFEETRREKTLHAIFINLKTAQIRCVACGIEIPDLQRESINSLGDEESNPIVDTMKLRLKVLPELNEMGNNRIVGPLQNSEGHRRASRGLVGLFSDKHSHLINSTVQFVAQCKLISHFVQDFRPEGEIQSIKRKQLLGLLRSVLLSIESAQLRVIHTNELCFLLYELKPALRSYARKDPFELFLYLVGELRQETLHYYLSEPLSSVGSDEWELFYRKSQLLASCPLFECLEIGVKLNFQCLKCKALHSFDQSINFIKLNFPKKRKRQQQIERELVESRYESPTKNAPRHKSLFLKIFTPSQQPPYTIPELLHDFLKHPFQPEQKYTDSQKIVSLLRRKAHAMQLQTNVQSFPQVLIFRINRLLKDGFTDDETPLHLETGSIDMGVYSSQPQRNILYEFETAMCVQGSFYSVICRSSHNRQLYEIKNEVCRMLSKDEQIKNAYVIVYRKKKDPEQAEAAKQLYKVISEEDTKLKVFTGSPIKNGDNRHKTYMLPDNYLVWLKHGCIPIVRHPLICKHGMIKPGVSPRSYSSIEHQVSLKNYFKWLDLVDWHGYELGPCEDCLTQIELIQRRKRQEKELVLKYDKTPSPGQCMISCLWVAKWSSYLYGGEPMGYFQKGMPMPGPVSNLHLLEGERCRVDISKNVDYKVVGIFLWRFLKELYGGGPEIRFKWKKSTSEKIDDEILRQIKQDANALKEIYKPVFSVEAMSHKKSVYELSSMADSLGDEQMTEADKADRLKDSSMFVSPQREPKEMLKIGVYSPTLPLKRNMSDKVDSDFTRSTSMETESPQPSNSSPDRPDSGNITSTRPKYNEPAIIRESGIIGEPEEGLQRQTE